MPRQSRFLVVVFVAGLMPIITACDSSSPTSPDIAAATTPAPAPGTPAPPPTTPSGPSVSIDLRVTNVLTGQGLPGVIADGNGLEAEPSDASGRLSIVSAHTASDLTVHFHGDAVVARTSIVRVPGAPNEINLIPASFDLASFDQMARQPAIMRWTSAPSIVVEQRVLKYEGFDQGAWSPTQTMKSAAEVNSLMADLNAGLPELTGGAFTSFSSARSEISAAGSPVPVGVSGRITVYWVEGLTTATGYDAYARWEHRDNVLTGAVILLDVRGDTSVHSRWLRLHELGHTLGYSHVTSRPSLMAPVAQAMTDFDRVAARLAYSRAPGNRSPDIDPSSTTLNSTTGASRWSAWMGSRAVRARH